MKGIPTQTYTPPREDDAAHDLRPENEHIFDDDAAPTDEQLASLEDMVGRALTLQDSINTLEDALAAHRKELAQIVEGDLVKRMLASGVTTFTTTAGLKVDIKSGLFVSELKDPYKRAERANVQAKWLIENGGAALVKDSIEMVFDKGSHDECERIAKLLDEMRAPYILAENVHAGSLKAFVAEILEEGKDVPLNDLGLYQKREALISSPQIRKKRK